MLVFFTPGSIAQMISAIVIALFCLKVYTSCSPFVHHDENVLAETSQWAIIFTLLAAVMI